MECWVGEEEFSQSKDFKNSSLEFLCPLPSKTNSWLSLYFAKFVSGSFSLKQGKDGEVSLDDKELSSNPESFVTFSVFSSKESSFSKDLLVAGTGAWSLNL